MDSPAGVQGDTANKRIWIDVEKADIRYLIKTVMKSIRQSYVLDQGVQGSITVKLDGLPLQLALDRLLAQHKPPLQLSAEDGVLHFKSAAAP